MYYRASQPHLVKEGTTQSTQCSHCVICLSDFTSGVEVRRLACLHLFHTSCVDVWLLNNRQEVQESHSDLTSSLSECARYAGWMWRPPLLSSAPTGHF